MVGAAVSGFRRWVAAAALSAAAVFAARFVLVRYGYAPDTGDVRLLDLLVASAFVLVVVSLRRRLGSSDASAEQRIALVAGILALPVAFVSLGQLLGPTAPKQGGTESCSGAAVAGSRLQARTGDFGLNARSGPGTTYAPEGRFDAGCSIGADGYCVGEAVQDLVVPLPDVRWLRLRHTDRYVAAGTLFALSPEAALGNGPEDGCPEGLADPALAADPEIIRLDDETLLVSARPERTSLVGFALYYGDESQRAVEQLGAVPKVTDDSGSVHARLKLPAVRQAAPGRKTVLAVVPCLAPIVPSHSSEHLFSVDVVSGSSADFDGELPDGVLDRLRQAGCRVDPSASNEQIAVAAESIAPD